MRVERKMGKAEEMYSMLLLSKQETDWRSSSRLLFILSTIPLCFNIGLWLYGKDFAPPHPSSLWPLSAWGVDVQVHQVSQALFAILLLLSIWFYYKSSTATHQLAKQRKSIDKLSSHQRSLLGLAAAEGLASTTSAKPQETSKTPQSQTRRVVYTPVSGKSKTEKASSRRVPSKSGVSYLGMRQDPLIHTSPHSLNASPMLVPQKARELGLVTFGGSDDAWIGSPAELELRQAAMKAEQKVDKSDRSATASTSAIPGKSLGNTGAFGQFLGPGPTPPSSAGLGFGSSRTVTSPIGLPMGASSFSRMGVTSPIKMQAGSQLNASRVSPVMNSPMYFNKNNNGLNMSTMVNTPTANSPRINPGSGPFQYQLNVTPSFATRTPQKIVDDEKAYRLLEELPVDWLSGSPVAFFIEEWTDNLRRELSKQIKTVLSLLDRNTKQFKELLGDMMQPKILSYEVEETLHNEMYEGTIARAFQMCAQANNAQAHNSLSQLVQERKRLEHYLSVQRHSTLFPRGYVVQRLKALVSSGDLMPKFQWSGGESFKGIGWQAEKFPTDAEIIIHAMAAWLDDTLRTSIMPSSSGFPSSQSSFLNYHMRYATTSDLAQLSESQYWGWVNATSDAHLQQTHYKVMVKGNLWEVRSGRQNVFQAIVLLLYSMKRKKVAGIEAHEKIIGGRSY